MNRSTESSINSLGAEEKLISTLDRIMPGQYGRVLSLSTAQPMRRRLLDIGFTDGTQVLCVMRSPLGDPTAYLVRGTLIALRREEAGTVNIIK